MDLPRGPKRGTQTSLHRTSYTSGWGTPQPVEESAIPSTAWRVDASGCASSFQAITRASSDEMAGLVVALTGPRGNPPNDGFWVMSVTGVKVLMGHAGSVTVAQ